MFPLALATLVVAALAVTSLFVGVGDMSLAALVGSDPDNQALQLLLISRVPRTLALILAGAATGVAGMLMQRLMRNRFVEPATAGTVEAASLGILTVALLVPDMDILGKMLVASLFALGGTALFQGVLSRIPLRSVLIVPLVGLMLSGIIEAVTTFIALRTDMLQSVNSWTTGDFSTVLRGRYELLWIALALTGVGYIMADRFTLIGMGRNFATNLGLNYNRVMFAGLTLVSVITGVVVVTVGVIPFLGLIVPNIVSLTVGDNLRRSVPWVAVASAGFVLLCDLIGRLVIAPYEIPVGVIGGVIGGALFLYLLLRRDTSLG